ncbi:MULTISPECIES: hypothetical protein [unclassified Modestobacter]|uniref:hypothetical protein n=1 Tax=unclassified Modestobacter TaxID=2643866 RepID=UPI0022AB4C20|nr:MULTISPECIES: hypothetical protein [unclassified Modestobacter]MCZ2825205.1 hypothetical protein [Modestobacter sp. VKM Ac-2981]MCZ2853730.1 hypothetical protein [Modestobacter sp. VKM Ac-2982]
MSRDQHTVLRSMHDLGLATWFGGNLMGAVGLNKAAAAARDSTERTRLSSVGWSAWWPVQGAAMAAHLIGSVGMLRADRGRVATGPGATANTVLKTALTAAAIGTSVASGVLGAKIGAKAPVPSDTATDPGPGTPPDVAAAQKGQKPLQWVNPALTGVLIVLAAQQGEQQRTSSTVRGAVGAGLTSVKAAVFRAA